MSEELLADLLRGRSREKQSEGDFMKDLFALPAPVVKQKKKEEVH